MVKTSLTADLLGIDLDRLQRERSRTEWITVSQAARSRFVSDQTVYRHIWSGNLQAIKERGRWLVLRSDCERLW